MNLDAKLATMFLIVVALGTIGTTATTAFAQSEEEEDEIELDEEEQAAIETADEFVHEAFEVEAGQEPPSEEDVLFHQALCEFGITTEALEELGGCEILPPLHEED
jgi:hypothetical protein